MSTVPPRAALAAMLALALLVAPRAAAPHAALIKASPARRAVLNQPPARVDLWFSERLEPAYATLEVRDARDHRVDLGDVTVASDDPRRLSVSLPLLPPGRYRVRYRVVSVDGHVVEDAYPFTIRPRR